MRHNRVISFGDSFTWGSELSDSIDLSPKEILLNPEKYSRELEVLKERQIGPFSTTQIDGHQKNQQHGYSNLTWPALLANHVEANDYFCHAQPGMSNAGIVRTIMGFLNEFQASDLLVINWTYISRWEYYDLSEIRAKYAWKSVRPDSQSDIAKFYFKNLQSELAEKWAALQQMMLVSSTLKNKNIPFIMTCQDQLALDKEWHVTEYITSLQDEIGEDIIWFDGKGFNDWAVDNQYPLGKMNNHPLEEAHQAAFEYIKNELALRT